MRDGFPHRERQRADLGATGSAAHARGEDLTDGLRATCAIVDVSQHHAEEGDTAMADIYERLGVRRAHQRPWDAHAPGRHADAARSAGGDAGGGRGIRRAGRAAGQGERGHRAGDRSRGRDGCRRGRGRAAARDGRDPGRHRSREDRPAARHHRPEERGDHAPGAPQRVRPRVCGRPVRRSSTSATAAPRCRISFRPPSTSGRRW